MLGSSKLQREHITFTVCLWFSGQVQCYHVVTLAAWRRHRWGSTPLASWFCLASEGQVLSPDLVQVCACVLSLPETHTNESQVLGDSRICICNGKWK